MTDAKSVVKVTKFNIYPNSARAASSFIICVNRRDIIIEIRIYDNLGRLINILKNEYNDIGTFELMIDISRIENGVYYYIAEAGNCKSVGKLNILK
jgi:hypothetical protein